MKKLSPILLLGLILIWLTAFRPLALGGRTSYLIVSGASMQPTLHNGDLAVMLRQPTYATGDVVAYPVSGGLVIHRIVAVTAQGYLTQGDNRQHIDPWAPGNEHVIGKLWFSIPWGGRVLVGLRQPISLAALALLGALVLLDEPVKTRAWKRGKRMSTNTWNTLPHVRAALPGRLKAAPAASTLDLSWLLLACGFFVLMALLSLALALFSHRLPVNRTVTVDRLRYTHQADYRYSVQVEPNGLTGSSVIGPVGPTTGESAAQPAVFTRLAKSIVVEFHYLLQSSQAAALQGELTPHLELRQDRLLLATLPLWDSCSFSTGELTWRAGIPIDEVTALIGSLQEQAGYFSGSYTVALVPNLHLTGSLGDHAIDDRVQPEFTFQITDSQIRFDPLQAWSEEKVIQEEVAAPNEIRFWRFALPVRDARLMSPWLVGLSLLGALFTGWAAWWALRRDEVARIHTRYGGIIASVAEMRLHSNRVVQVSSFRDLVRLSQRFNCLILHQGQDGGPHVYLIPDGDVLYLYRVGPPAGEG